MTLGNYPRTVAESVRPGMKYRRGVVAAARAFKRSRPYRGTPDERARKFGRLVEALAQVYGMEPPRFAFVVRDPEARTGNGRCVRREGERTRITLFDKLSVVTLLHEFGHALGKDERGACRWSINLFRRVFPVLASRCDGRGHMLVAGGAR